MTEDQRQSAIAMLLERAKAAEERVYFVIKKS